MVYPNRMNPRDTLNIVSSDKKKSRTIGEEETVNLVV